MESDSAATLEGQIPQNLEQEIKSSSYSNDLELRLIDALRNVEEIFGPVCAYKEVERLLTDIEKPSDTDNKDLIEFLKLSLWELFPKVVAFLDEGFNIPRGEIIDSAIGCLKRALEIEDRSVREEAVDTAIDLADALLEDDSLAEALALASMVLPAEEGFPDKIQRAADLLKKCAEERAPQHPLPADSPLPRI